MRSILLAAAVLLSGVLGGASVTVAQESYNGDAAATYHWVHTNAGPGQCGCFGLNGAGLSGSVARLFFRGLLWRDVAVARAAVRPRRQSPDAPVRFRQGC